MNTCGIDFRRTGWILSPSDFKSHLHHHKFKSTSKFSLAFFIARLHSYMTGWKNYRLLRRISCWQSTFRFNTHLGYHNLFKWARLSLTQIPQRLWSLKIVSHWFRLVSSICYQVTIDVIIFSFECCLKPILSLHFHSHQENFISHFVIRMGHSYIRWGDWYFSSTLDFSLRFSLAFMMYFIMLIRRTIYSSDALFLLIWEIQIGFLHCLVFIVSTILLLLKRQ